MPRKKSSAGDGTLRTRQLANGTTVYDVRWSYRDADGRAQRGHQRGFRTERDANRFRRDVTRAVDAGTYVKPSTMTLGQWLVQWLASARLAPQTLAGYERDAYRRITPLIGHIRLLDLRASHLNGLYRTLETSGCPGGRGPLSPSTVRNVHATLCSALTAAVNDELMPDSPAKKASPPTPRQVKATRPTMQTWVPDEVRTFLEATSGDRLGPLWHLLLSTGMRRGEALALRWSDVDLDDGYLAVQRSLGEDRRKGPDGKRIGLVFGPTKSGRAHSIALDATTVAVLRGHRARQATQRLLLGDRWRDNDLVFCRGTDWLKDGDQGGTPLHPDRTSESFRRAVARVPVSTIRLHDCRHTWATLALASGVHPKVVQERLGHANISITMDIYSHVTRGMDADAATLVAGLFTGITLSSDHTWRAMS